MSYVTLCTHVSSSLCFKWCPLRHSYHCNFQTNVLITVAIIWLCVHMSLHHWISNDVSFITGIFRWMFSFQELFAATSSSHFITVFWVTALQNVLYCVKFTYKEISLYLELFQVIYYLQVSLDFEWSVILQYFFAL